jgi:hypothetical protein
VLPCPEDAFVRFPAGLNAPGGILIVVVVTLRGLVLLILPGGSTLVGGGGDGGVAGEDPTTDGGTIEFAPSSHLSQEAFSPLESY